MRDIDLKSLRLFAAVCDNGNIKAAAAQEHIEPSAISKRLAQLEDQLGIQLLVRGRMGAELTPAGQALLEHVRSLMFTVQRIEADMDSFKGGIKGHVRLAASASASRMSEGEILCGWLPGRTGMSPSTMAPVRSVRPLWPGIWNGDLSVSMSRIHASSRGADDRNPIGSLVSRSVAAPNAC